MPAWTCPRCRKLFDLPEGWETPQVCAECVQARKSGPPKPPVLPKPVAVAPPEIPAEIVPVPVKFSAFRLVGLLLGIGFIVLFSAVAAVGWQQNQEFEAAQKEADRLHQQKMEQDQQRFNETLAKLDQPAPPAAPAPVKSNFIARGETCTVGADGGAVILVPKWEDSDELNKYLLARDTQGILNMHRAGKAFSVESGTEAKMLAPGIVAHELRILTGDQAGKQGFLSTDYVQKK